MTPEDLSQGSAPLLEVVEAGAPGFPLGLFAFVTMFAVADSALIYVLMASRLLYGMADERVLPRVLGKVHRTRRTPWVATVFTTALAFGLTAPPSAPTWPARCPGGRAPTTAWAASCS